MVTNATRGLGSAMKGGQGDGLMGAHPSARPVGPQVWQPNPAMPQMGLDQSGGQHNLERQLKGAKDNRSLGENELANIRVWFPRMDFPLFEGEDTRIWIDNYDAYFALYLIPEEFKVSAASLQLRGRAAHWFQVFR